MKPSLYAHPFASFCQKVLIALYENGTDFTYRKIGPEDPAAMSELMALWPLKKFPVLVDEGHTYVESSIIISIWQSAIRVPFNSFPKILKPRSKLACWIASSTTMS